MLFSRPSLSTVKRKVENESINSLLWLSCVTRSFIQAIPNVSRQSLIVKMPSVSTVRCAVMDVLIASSAMTRIIARFYLHTLQLRIFYNFFLKELFPVAGQVIRTKVMSSDHIIVILTIFCLTLFGLCFSCFFNCIRKLRADHTVYQVVFLTTIYFITIYFLNKNIIIILNPNRMSKEKSHRLTEKMCCTKRPEDRARERIDLTFLTTRQPKLCLIR